MNSQPSNGPLRKGQQMTDNVKIDTPAPNENPRQCCGENPEVFEMRPDEWAVHCRICWEGTFPCATREDAIREWNEMT